MNRLTFKNILGAAVVLAAIAGGQSCVKEKEQETSIILEAPANNATVDLADGNVLFRWSTDSSVGDGFTLVLNGEDPAHSKTWPVKGTAYSREIVASDLDILLKEWGARPNGTVALRWTVTSSVEGQGHTSEERTLKVKVLPAITEKIYVTAPAENEILDLDNEESFTFSWSESLHISSYRLEFAAEENGEAVKTWDGLKGSSTVILAQELLDVTKALDPDKKSGIVPAYWRVVATDEFYTGASAFSRVRIMRDAPLSAVANLSVRPGYKRAIVSCSIDDPRTASIVVKYGTEEKSFEIRKGASSFSEEFTELPEAELTFSVAIKDKNGNLSPEAKKTVKVYGDSYVVSKSARTGKLFSLKRAGAGISMSSVSDRDLVKTSVVYLTESGDATVELGADETFALIPSDAAKFGSDVEIVSEYLPVEDALDPVVKKSSVYVPVYGMVPLEVCKHWPDAASDDKIIAGDHGMLGGYGYEKLFDGKYNLTGENMWHTGGGSKNASGSANSLKSSPICLTVDLGTELYLSGLVFWGRRAGVIYEDGTFKAYGDGDTGVGSIYAYGAYNPRSFEVWVSSEEPVNIADEKVWAPADGSWKTDGSWTRICTGCRVMRPSGKDCPTGWTNTYGKDGNPTLEDMRQAVDGFEFPVDSYDAPVKGRYVRIVITENWHKDQIKRVSMDELHFYSFTPKQ